jgi:WhiB family redox-sensing transcriptional regulator
MTSDWRTQAACRDEDPELFFPAANTGPGWAVQVTAAKAVCQRCPVLEQCQAFAFEGLRFGVAGGMTEQERAAARRSRSGKRGQGAQRLDQVRDDRNLGRLLLGEGVSPRDVASRCGVSQRTALRWAAALRSGVEASAGEAS